MLLMVRQTETCLWMCESMRSGISVVGCKQGWLRQNRSIETLREPELACPPSVVPVLMQLHSEQGRNISLRCAVSGQWNTVMVHFLTLTYANSHHQNNSNSLRTQNIMINPVCYKKYVQLGSFTDICTKCLALI